MIESSRAVFLSYASEDGAAAERIATALRSAGIEVWFDQSELRGGEAWDRKIRKEIHDCALFIPVISANAHARDEGYFRLEWKLAADRSHLMAPDKAFLLPVVIDNTPQTDERIPDRFRELQWSRLPEGQVSPAFIGRVQRLLSPVESDESRNGPDATRSVSAATPAGRRSVGSFWSSRRVPGVVAAVMVLGALAYLAADKFPISRHPTLSATPAGAPASASVAPATFSPPPHSIAVLPFVNMSGDKEQDYFSEGLTEELLNSLSRINQLQVAARTSSFSFQGEHPDIATVAHKLNVGAVLEGSVRRSSNTVRITAQLVNGLTGFHLWSATYDRKLGDVLTLETEIATAVASALKVTLLGDEAAKIEVGGTRNPAAFDAYLRASKAYATNRNGEDLQSAISGYGEATRLDPNYALAYADRSFALSVFGDTWAETSAVRDYLDEAQRDARRAIALAPELGTGHLALARVLEDSLEFMHAGQEYERALALAPGDARVLGAYSSFAIYMGRTEAGLTAAKRSVALDPLNFKRQFSLGLSQFLARRYDEAIRTFTGAKVLAPDDAFINGWLGFAYYGSGDFQSARRACEGPGHEALKQYCLALVFAKLGRRAEAETALAKAHALWGGQSAIYALVYAQWGDTGRALDSLEAAMRHRDPDLEFVKMHPWYDPLREEPRFQAIERALKFPN